MIEETSNKQRDILNGMLIEYKRNIDEMKEVKIKYSDLELDFEIKPIVFTVNELTKKPKYNRAKEKREFEKRANEGIIKWEDER